NYKDQWNFAYMGFEEVWCYNKGGINELGDTIAIGVIDFGFNYTLSDIDENVFRNYNEISDNEIDDDSNGYVDDYLGFNARIGIGDDHLLDENHGTNVIHLVGARGNNNLQLTGANQQIKIVLCSANDDASMVKCYSYFIQMKSDYLSSGGQKGAFIVASSISLGYDEDMPENHPAVCNMYDLLGNQGILNVCATINDDANIDTHGDVPSLCPSPYLISVTNTDRSDTKASAGYSKTNVDIGASGEIVPVIESDGSIVNKSGCSLSAPQVGGGIAYLNQYCKKFNLLSKSNPSESALLMKEFILKGGNDNLSLRDITSSGKRFNIEGSFNRLLAYCEILGTNDVLNVKSNIISDQIIYELKLKKFQDYQIEIYNLAGQSVYYKTFNYSLGNSVLHTISVHTFPPGIYYLTARTTDVRLSKTILKL
ncbi:MAG: S8 family serine peptidase, partial [Saprospiraceae bacterium]